MRALCPRPQDEDTICALATPPGQGALALIRVSGKQAFAVTRKLCPFLPKPKDIISHRIYFGSLFSLDKKDPVDEVLTSCFVNGKSFTGEESTEISCHGGKFIAKEILDNLVSAGARLAERGEFSYRAFMNGRIDLIQAESILQLIDSRSPVSHQQALKSLKGEISSELKTLEKDLLKLLAFVEAGIDFSDQDISLVSIEEQLKLLEKIQGKTQQWIKNFQQGKINREGFSILLMGATNSGKSSLFNCLIGESRAIVTHHPGTTRDVLESSLLFNQREFRLKDTAGFRESSDPIEQLGLKKVLGEIKSSHLLLFLVDGSQTVNKKSFLGLDQITKEQKLLLVFSKSDLISSVEDRKKQEKTAETLLQEILLKHDAKIEVCQKPIWISSKNKEGIEPLKNIFCLVSETEVGEVFLSNSRHLSAIEEIKSFLDKAKSLLEKKSSPEFIAFELQSALKILYKMTGQEYNEQVVEQIFKEFCLGK